MYDYRLVAAYMSEHLQPRPRRPPAGRPAVRVYKLPAERRTPRNERGR
jgi:hypothetical protein